MLVNVILGALMIHIICNPK